MNAHQLRIERPVHMELTGKFVAPSADWIHLSRYLMDYELIVMTHGTLYISGDDETYEVSQGEYLLLPPFTRQKGAEPSDCSFYWLHFSSSQNLPKLDLSHYTHVHENGRIVIPQYGTLRNPEKIVVMMKQLQDSVRGYNEQTLNDYMSTVILCELYNQLFFEKNNPGKSFKQTQLYNDILDYIKWSRHENIKVSEIASHFGYNEKYLSHLFTTVSGISLKQYILQQKMELAKYLLTDTNQNVSEISSQLGYSDPHHFMKSFKKIMGLTPTEFRNAYSKRLLFYE
ncbi:AraC family transcriptional regulator [Paenibacillus sp. Y412MC10]|uniref:AraC family transcriptional regulator n=1 Tax=Geobacillus sp. (strain Y412MC10) TaxID=481743 RepID=UPI0011A93C94|nr:AraC family transcriptional regulator [Paenibacillus sp. Y412MC10]